MGVNDLGGYDIQKYSHNIPKQTETVLKDVIGTDQMSCEDGDSRYGDKESGETSEDYGE